MSASYTIETSHLRKEYSRKVAVADLDLQVGQGEVFGFLGPNGAGKTTSIKMLLGLAKPTNGGARLLGRPIGDPQSRSRVGFLPEHFRFHDWLNGAEFLDLHAQLYGLGESDRRQRIPALLKRVGLEEHAAKKLRGYSKGMLQRIGLAQALLNRPAVVFLDEPTSGLDPIGRILVRDIIRELRAEGTTVFLNSHLVVGSGDHLRSRGLHQAWHGDQGDHFERDRAGRDAGADSHWGVEPRARSDGVGARTAAIWR